MEKHNYTVMLLLVCAIVQVHSSFEGVNAEDDLAAIGSNRIAAENESAVDVLPGDEEPNDPSSPVIFAGHADRRIRRTPGAPNNSSEKLEKLKKALASSGVTPAVPQSGDLIRVQRDNLIRDFNRIVADLMRVHRIRRNEAYLRALLEHENLVDQIILMNGP
ncbi:uncharacterized protein [Venturia canescens]|uniref:uncharacterized protein n=1 Tax=Venturia canescens TaxID=32260 RepID=UPI001C9C5288|nr:uncharacterized protein LOC122415771 [Venturia canescens]